MLSHRLCLLFLARSAAKSARSGKHREGRKENSRGSQIGEIHRRLAEFNRVQVEVESEYKVDSLIAEKRIQSDKDVFAKVIQRREEERVLVEERGRETRTSNQLNFPLSQNTKIIHSPHNLVSPTSSALSSSDDIIDRGFYIDGNQYVDEYVAGTTHDIPDDEMTAPSRMVFGPSDAVEHIDFQLPGQRLSEEIDDHSSLDNSDNLEWNEQYGTVDPERKESEKKCGGCAANLHCKDSSLPGFLPLEIFDKVDRKKKVSSDILCKRCHLLKHHNFLLNVNVCPVDYISMMSHLKMKEECLIILVVDITDIHGSIHKHLPNIIGSRKPMIVVANKVDLLPPDARCGYLKRFKMIVEKAIEDAGFTHKFNVLHTALVSAKTGYGIEELITEMHMKWTNVKLNMRSDVYLVGCTNAGKSTLFNAFLQSDLCKVRAVDLVERATTSPWPGTTISLLKFPVMKPSPYRLELRKRRLLTNRAWQQKENYIRKQLLQQTGDKKYAVLTGTIQNTYKEQEDELQPIALDALRGEEQEEKKKSWSMDDDIFTKGTWCYDTPGTVNDQQLVNMFTLSELVHVLPRSLLSPRTCLVHPGYSLVVGGVGTVDVVETSRGDAVYLSAFVSDDLPLNVMPTSEVDQFLKRHQITGALVVPEGGEDRMSQFPPLDGREITVRGEREKEKGSRDLILSSIGWILLTSSDRSISLRLSTPGGKGITTRQPILPYAASLRGKRIPGTQFYKVQPIDFPVNDRRIRAEKNKRKQKREWKKERK